MVANIVNFVFTGIWFSVFLIGCLDFMFNYEANNCQMTYMYEMPEYVNIPLDKAVAKQFPKYRLFLYGEGYKDDVMRRPGYAVSGLPVLFIPGSRGSHEQVRSLASVALRRVQYKKSKFHFNYFAVDLNQELSGLYGGVLKDQTRFVVESIKHIRAMYLRTSKTPKSIVLVGHSMGGLLARAVFMQPDFDPASVHTILTQSSPHQAPVIAMDSHLIEFHSRLDDYWRHNIGGSLRNVAVMSVGGGYRDLLVRNGLTTPNHYGAASRILSTSSLSVPLTWMATDHRAIVWCKQFVLATTRALFDMVDKETNLISNDLTYRLSALKHHFLDHSGADHPVIIDAAESEVQLDQAVKYLDVTESNFYVNQKVDNKAYVSMDVSKATKGTYFIAICRRCVTMWILGCTSLREEGRCAKALDLSHKGRLLPPLANPQKVVHLTDDDLSRFKRIIMIVPKSEWQVQLRAEIYPNVRRHLNISTPAFLANFPASLYQYSTVLASTDRGALFYNLTLPDLETVRQAYTVRLQRKGCYDIAREHEELVAYHLPWAREDVYNHSSSRYGLNMTLKLQTGMPKLWSGPRSQLHLYPDDDCVYTLDMIISIPEIFGQLIRYYANIFPGFVVANIILSLTWQLATLETKDESCLWYFKLVKQGAHPTRFLPFVVLPHVIMSFAEVRTFVYSLGLPALDGHILEQRGIWDMVVVPISFFLSNALVTVAGLVALSALRIVAAIVGLMLARCPSSKLVSSLVMLADLIVHCLALLVVLTSSAGLGQLIITAASMIKVVCLMTTGGAGAMEAWRVNRPRVYYLLFLLNTCVLAIMAPSLITWYGDLRRFDMVSLTSDPWKLVGSALILAQLIIALVDNERLYGHSSRWTYRVMHLTVIVIPFYAILSIHQLAYFIAFVFLLFSLRGLRSVTRSTRKADASVKVDREKKSQ